MFNTPGVPPNENTNCLKNKSCFFLFIDIFTSLRVDFSEMSVQYLYETVCKAHKRKAHLIGKVGFLYNDD